jgi:hypothetical protein
MMNSIFHDNLKTAFQTAIGGLGAPLDGVEEAPLAVQGAAVLKIIPKPFPWHGMPRWHGSRTPGEEV